MGSLQHRARFLCELTLFAKDDDCLIELLHERLSDLLFRLGGLRRRSGIERFVCVCGNELGVWLWLRALMPRATAWIRSRSCSKTAVGVRDGSSQLGSRIWSRVHWMRRWSLWSSTQYVCLMEHHCCNTSGADVWVAAIVVVEVVSQPHRESSCSTESAVCTATEHLVSRNPFERPNDCHRGTCCSPSRSLGWPNQIFA